MIYHIISFRVHSSRVSRGPYVSLSQKMTTLIELPQEVIQLILTQVHDQDIHSFEQCSSVCHAIVSKTIGCCLQHSTYLEVSNRQISSIIRRIELVDLNNLQELSIFITQLSVEDINHFLSRCPALLAVKIRCDNAPRNYLDLSALRLPETVDWLNLNTLPLTDEGFPSLKHLHKLFVLSVEKTRITHTALQHIPFQSIMNFSIRFNDITDKAFRDIMMITKLQCLLTRGIYLSERSVAALKNRGIIVV
jgi:hypothetical protein